MIFTALSLGFRMKEKLNMVFRVHDSGVRVEKKMEMSIGFTVRLTATLGGRD